jgi:hypothetical protein
MLRKEIIAVVKNIFELHTEVGVTLCGLIMLQSDRLLEEIGNLLGFETVNLLFAKMYDPDSSFPGKKLITESSAFTANF